MPKDDQMPKDEEVPEIEPKIEINPVNNLEQSNGSINENDFIEEELNSTNNADSVEAGRGEPQPDQHYLTTEEAPKNQESNQKFEEEKVD